MKPLKNSKGSPTPKLAPYPSKVGSAKANAESTKDKAGLQKDHAGPTKDAEYAEGNAGPEKGSSGIAIYAFTSKGAALAALLAEGLDGYSNKSWDKQVNEPVIYLSANCVRSCAPNYVCGHARTGEQSGARPKEKNHTQSKVFSGLRALLADVFHKHRAHIFIGAAGIAVRGIAPFLQGKERDPAVLTLDQRAGYVVSLLSGHLGGANALCIKVAALLGATPVISTATDLENLPAIDLLAQEAGLAIANLEAVKVISGVLLEGVHAWPVFVDDPQDRLGLADKARLAERGWTELFAPLPPEQDPLTRTGNKFRPLIQVTHKLMPILPDILLLRPKNLWVGLGCKRGVPMEVFKTALEETFAAAGLSLDSLAGFASIAQKSCELGLLELAHTFALPIKIFQAEELAGVNAPSLSPKALELFGTPSVAEAAALLAANRGQLLLPKQAVNNVTLAVTESFL